jgi:hypothetical protein
MQAADIECDRITSSDSSRQGNRVESKPVIDATGIGINVVWSTQQVLLQAHPSLKNRPTGKAAHPAVSSAQHPLFDNRMLIEQGQLVALFIMMEKG